MLDTLNLDVGLNKDTYKTQLEALMRQLRPLQNACWQNKLPMLIVLEGWAAAGKGALVKQIVGYMDPRGFVVHPIWPTTKQERQYPFLWRFWQRIPREGKISLFYHSWYTHVLEDRLLKSVSEADIPIIMRHINTFERQMADNGAAIAKFWIHLGKKELKKRLKQTGDDPLRAWRIRSQDWQQAKNYEKYTVFAEEMLIHTSTGFAPWTLVEGNCQRWARVKVLTEIVSTLTQALDQLHIRAPRPNNPFQEQLKPTEQDFLAQVDLTKCLSPKNYKKSLNQQQELLSKLQLEIYKHQLPVLIVFEGWDAAGKGGAIKRLTDNLDPRSYVVNAFAAPTEEEKAYHYLWRFWKKLPEAGKIGIFDRSWYGRVLVERVERFATESEWQSAYREINEFEEQLTTAGYVLVKFWLHLSQEEQLRRFTERQNDQFKQYKLTEEDWRNREKWQVYEVAVNQMIQRTSTPTAPWTLIAGDDKRYARVKVIQTVTEAINYQLKYR